VKVYIAMHLSQGEWLPLGEIPYAFSSVEENAWQALAAFGADPFKQAVVSVDEEQYMAGLQGWIKKC
jgi:hypothetical protein